jgi:hypothetical protein
MSLTSFEIVSVPVSDQERAKRFYRGPPGGKWIQLAPKGPA